MKIKNEQIICIVPAFNEEGKIGTQVKRLVNTKIFNMILVVNDGSNDDTAIEAGKAGAVVISNKKNFGVGRSIIHGLKYSLQHNFTIGSIISGDLQHDPKDFHKLLKFMLKNKIDMVTGSRFGKGGKIINGPLIRVLMTRSYALIYSIMVFKYLKDPSNGMRIFRLSIFEKLNLDLEKSSLNSYEFEPYFLFKAIKSKKIIVHEIGITVSYADSKEEFSKMKPFIDWWKLVKPPIFLGLKIWK